MKKKSTSQSAFLNVRVLFGLCVILVGVFLALVSFGTFSNVLAQTNSNAMTRQDLVGMYEAVAPADFVPPACVPGSEMFADVPASNPFCPWIEELARQHITSGCAPGLFCPANNTTRQEIAVFIVRATAKSLFAVVNSDGTLARGRGVVSTQLITGFAGAYEIIFDTDTTGCAYIGSIGNAGAGTASDGFLTTALRSGTTNGVFVQTSDTTGLNADRPFHVHLLCP
jgi:hypothetical protein